MTTHRQCACAALVFIFAFACGGDEGDTKLCKELRTAVEAEKILQKETRVALKAAVDLVLATPPVAGADNCEADGLNAQKFVHLTPEIVERGHLGDPFYLGDLGPGSSCGKVNPENTKNKLVKLQDNIKTTAAGNRLFFVDIERVGAKLLGDKSFAPGNVKGRLLVWSDAEDKFICTGESFAESGKNLYTTKGGVKKDKDLDDHLTRNAVKSGIASLKKIEGLR